MARKREDGPVRYAVVGLGHIAQVAVLPAFAHATENSAVTALISDDAGKRVKVGRKYKVKDYFGYDQYDEALASGLFDAVYIALPNHLHREYAERAARSGIHVLCEKPLAVTAEDCEAMIRTADDNGVKLMTAYRLHFDEANLKAVEVVQSGRIGEPKLFNSTFTLQVRDGDIRLNPRSQGGGVLYDIGIYCINAARYLFEAEPESVFAMTDAGDDPRFESVEESVTAMLRFPGGAAGVLRGELRRGRRIVLPGGRDQGRSADGPRLRVRGRDHPDGHGQRPEPGADLSRSATSLPLSWSASPNASGPARIPSRPARKAWPTSASSGHCTSRPSRGGRCRSGRSTRSAGPPWSRRCGSRRSPSRSS